MSDHAWTQDHVAAFVAGGLSAEEAERLEAHARDCPDCAAAVAAARRLDRGLIDLFASERPGPALEDRMVRAFRVGRRPLMARWVRRLTAAAAVLAFVGTFGGVAASLVAGGRLPMPGEPVLARWHPDSEAPAERIHRESAARPDVDLTNEDLGLKPKVQAALPEIPRLDVPKEGGLAQQHGFNIGGGIGGGGGWMRSVPAISPQNASSVNYSAMPLPGRGEWGAIQFPADAIEPTAKPGPIYTWNTGGARNSNGAYFRPGDARLTLAQDPSKPGEGERDQKLDPKQAPPVDTRKPDEAPRPGQPNQPPAADPQPGPRRVVIRSGDIEFEVESFDAAVATVTKLVHAIQGGFVATVNSEKLPNGKVRGAVTVRVPPEHLDGLVLDLRKELGKGGELKGIKISSQDITKHFTDLESRLRAARTMEQRLIQIIKEGKGEIKQLLEAEKELGVWRTKIEELEGEIRYLGNLAALSTLTITLAEKEIRSAAGVTERERVQAGVEVEDVDKAYQQVLAAVAEAKGRVMKSELKQLSAGQFNASLHFEVAPEAAGPLRDRLHQTGRVARLEIDRVQQAEGGTVPKDAKVTRGDTVFLVQLYNLANVAPRETAVLQLAAPDVAAAYQGLRDALGKARARVLNAQLNEQDRQNVTAQLDFEVRRGADDAAVQAALAAAGEVVARQVSRAPESDNVTDTKVLYRATLFGVTRLKPRETTTLTVEVADVDTRAKAFAADLAEAKGRQVDIQTARQPNGRVTAKLVYDVPLAAAAGLVERFRAAGTVKAQQSSRDPQAPEGQYATARLDVTLTSAEPIVPGDDGLWPPVKKGLTYSASVLLTSVTWVVFGLCVVLPWAVVGYGGYRVGRRLFRSNPPTPTPPAPQV